VGEVAWDKYNYWQNTGQVPDDLQSGNSGGNTGGNQSSGDSGGNTPSGPTFNIQPYIDPNRQFNFVRLADGTVHYINADGSPGAHVTDPAAITGPILQGVAGTYGGSGQTTSPGGTAGSGPDAGGSNQRIGGVNYGDSTGPVSPVTGQPTGPGASVAGGVVQGGVQPGTGQPSGSGLGSGSGSTQTTSVGGANVNVAGTTINAVDTGQGTSLGGALMTPAMLNALVAQMDSAAAGAIAESKSRGVVMRPVFNDDGSWGYEPVNGPDGQPIRTVDAQLTDAQIADLAAKTVLSLASASGKIKDPETGQWIQTPTALRDLASAALTNAQTGQTAAETAYISGAKTALTNAQVAATTAETDYTAGAKTTLTNAQATLAQAQARKQALDAAIEQGKLTGQYVDPDTGQVVPTLDAKKLEVDNALTQAQTAVNQAQTGLVAAQTDVATAGLTGRYQGQDTLAKQKQDMDLAIARANAIGSMRDPVTGEDIQTLEARKQDVDRQMKAAELTGYLDGQTTLTREQQAFNQAQVQANLASNPRNYIEASMLGASRGGLSGFAPTNQVAPTTTVGGQVPQAPQAEAVPFRVPGALPPGSGSTPNYADQFRQMEGGLAAELAPLKQQHQQALASGNQALAGQLEAQIQQRIEASGINRIGDLANQQQQPQTAGYNATGQLPQGPPGTGQAAAGAGAINYDSLAPDRMRPETPAVYRPAVMPQPAIGAQPDTGQVPFQVPVTTAGVTSAAGAPKLPGVPAGAPFLPFSTIGTPEGGQLRLFSSATGDATIPVTAAQRALISGRPVPMTGGLNQQGGYASAAALRSVVNPAKWRGGDFARMTRDEQAQAKGLASLAGFSDNATEDLTSRTLPGFRAPRTAQIGVPTLGSMLR